MAVLEVQDSNKRPQWFENWTLIDTPNTDNNGEFIGTNTKRFLYQNIYVWQLSGVYAQSRNKTRLFDIMQYGGPLEQYSAMWNFLAIEDISSDPEYVVGINLRRDRDLFISSVQPFTLYKSWTDNDIDLILQNAQFVFEEISGIKDRVIQKMTPEDTTDELNIVDIVMGTDEKQPDVIPYKLAETMKQIFDPENSELDAFSVDYQWWEQDLVETWTNINKKPQIKTPVKKKSKPPLPKKKVYRPVNLFGDDN